MKNVSRLKFLFFIFRNKNSRSHDAIEFKIKNSKHKLGIRFIESRERGNKRQHHLSYQDICVRRQQWLAIIYFTNCGIILMNMTIDQITWPVIQFQSDLKLLILPTKINDKNVIIKLLEAVNWNNLLSQCVSEFHLFFFHIWVNMTW